MAVEDALDRAVKIIAELEVRVKALELAYWKDNKHVDGGACGIIDAKVINGQLWLDLAPADES